MLVAGVLAMHTLAGGGPTAGDHAAMTQGDMAMASVVAGATAPAKIELSDQGGLASHMGGACGAVGVCVALMAVVLLLLVGSPTGRALLRRRTDLIASGLRRRLSQARLPDPPDLYSLSILRC